MLTHEDLFDAAKKVIPGGVNSPVRAFKAVGGTPPFIARAKGAYVFDEEGRQLIDYVGSWGPMVLGHAHPNVIHAVKEAMDHGLSYGAPTHLETMLAETLCTLVPSMDQVRMVSSGTEAVMSAIRLARGFTHRDEIIKFEGGYHGHSDGLLVEAGSGLTMCTHPSSAGVPSGYVKHTLTAIYNDLNSVQALFESHPQGIAAVLVEPVAGNMNCITPCEGFLSGLRQLCDRYHAVLIFDEVMTGFRVDLHGAQGYYGVKPDLTILGKVIGGGMPLAAFGGRRAIMQCLAPLGDVYQAGTLSGNPIATTAGLATLRELSQPDFLERLTEKTTYLTRGLREIATRNQIGFITHQLGGMFGLFFTDNDTISHFKDTAQCNHRQFKLFFHAMLENNVYWAPSNYESAFMSIAHTQKDLDHTLSVAEALFKQQAFKKA